jgi:iron-regulated transporter 1
MRMEVPGGDSPRTSPQDGDALRYDIEEEMVSGVEFRSSSGVLDSGVEPQSSGLNNVDTGTIIINRKEVDRLVRCLYGSHFLSRWGDRMWEFAVSLFMLHVWPNSLLLVAVYGLVEAASVAAFGVVIGELVDKFPRLKVVQIALGVQNGSIVVAAVATVVLLLHPGAVLGGFGAFVTLVILVNTFGAFGALSGLAMDVVVERDWVVVIAEQAPGSLTRINSVMRRIDLSCKLLAPVAVGFLMSYASMLASAVLIAVWNVSSVGLEYGLLYIVYTAMPILQQKSPSRNTKLESPDAEKLAIKLEAKEIEMHSTAQEAQVQTEVGNLSTGAILVIACFWMCTSSLLVLHVGTQ